MTEATTESRGPRLTEMGELTMLHQNILWTERELSDKERQHKEEKDRLYRKLADLRTRAAHYGAGLDPDMILRARRVLDIRGSYATGGDERASVVKDAIASLVEHGGARLYSEFFGTKSYASWYGQRCDCGYGMGPRHGSIIFGVGLVYEVRDSKRPLTPEEIEAAVYYLTNIERIEAAAKTVTEKAHP